MQGGPPASEGPLRLVKISVSGPSGVGTSELVARIRRDAASGVLVTEAPAGHFIADHREPADVLVLIIDVHDGITAQARQYAASARSSGIRHIVLALNMLDLSGGTAPPSKRSMAAFGEFANRFEFTTATVIPISATSEENIDARSTRAAWYGGPTLLRASRRTQPRRRPFAEHPAGGAGHRAVRRAYRLCVGSGTAPRPRIQAPASRTGADGQRHGGEVSPGYRQPAPRAGAHARPRRDRRLHDRDADAADARRACPDFRIRTASSSATSIPTRRLRQAASTSPCAAA